MVRPEKFSKDLEKINEKFTIFENFLKFYRIFGENLGKNIENLRNMHLYWPWGRIPMKLANLLKAEWKNQWKPATFENFKGNFAIFSKPFKILSKFGDNLGKNIENFRNMHLYGARASEFIKNIIEKSLETRNF